MGGNMENALVIVKNGQAVTTSLKVAEVFKKQHRHVLRDIEALECSEEFARSNFGPGEYVDKNNQSRPMCEMTFDGWMFLVMGYSGKKAAEYKERYINAFNQMKQTNQGISNAIAECTQKITMMLENNTASIDFLRNDVSSVKDEVFFVKNEVSELAKCIRRPFSQKTKRIYFEVLMRYFGGLCPMCQRTKILGSKNCEIDHYKQVSSNKITEGWPLCIECHAKLTHGRESRSGWVQEAFGNFQNRVKQFRGVKNKPLQLSIWNKATP
jgi:Rha family phage regulatory protein